MENLKEKIIKKIENGEVKKKTFWYFLTKKYFLWANLLASVFVGAISFSLLLLNYFDSFGPWYRLRSSSDILLSKIFLIWILLSLVLLISIIFNFKKTKKSFRFELWKVVVVTMFSILILGFGFYKFGITEKIDNCLIQKSEKYHKIKIEWKKEIEKVLIANNINVKEFFKNKKIIELEEEWKGVDRKRVEKIKNILKSLKGKISKDDIQKIEKRILDIKIKKKEIDLLRLEKEIEIFKNNMLK